MRDAIRSFEAGGSTAEVIEYTNDKVPYLYTAIFDSDEMCMPVVESFEVERGESFEKARLRAIESFNSVVREFLELTH